MTKQVRLSEILIEKYHDSFHSTKYARQIFTSGRAGTKSSRMGIRFIQDIISKECATVVMRKRHNKLRKSVYKECVRAISRLGLNKQDFIITVAPMQITFIENGSTIYFAGSDNIDDTKGIIDENFPITRIALDEANEFFTLGDGADEIDNIEATFVRGNEDTQFIMELYFNPPRNEQSEIMKWLEKQKLRTDTLHIHTDYRDVPSKWLGRSLIQIAEQLKEIDIAQYEWIWLGLSTGIADVIYYMFKKDKHVQDNTQALLTHETVRWGVGVDYGQMNATTFQAFTVDKTKNKLLGVDEYYHSGRDSIEPRDISKEQSTPYEKWKRQIEIDCGKQKTPSDYAKDFKTFIEFIEEQYDTKISFVVIDPSASGLREEIKRIMPRLSFVTNQEIGERINTVNLGIERVQKALTYDAIILDKKQKNLIKEMGLYVYDEKTIKKGKESPLQENDHAQDAFRYLVMALWRVYIKKMLPLEERDNE